MACLPARVHTDTHWERHIQTDPHTHTNTGRPIDLLSSPPVVCSGFWLSTGPPFKGSAVVWANKAVAQDGAITTGLARIFLLAPKEMFPWLSPVSPVNVFTLNSPAGHSACTHACVHVCAYIYVSSKVTWRLPPPPGAYGNANHTDADSYSNSTYRNSSDNAFLLLWVSH